MRIYYQEDAAAGRTVLVFLSYSLFRSCLFTTIGISFLQRGHMRCGMTCSPSTSSSMTTGSQTRLMNPHWHDCFWNSCFILAALSSFISLSSGVSDMAVTN